MREASSDRVVCLICGEKFKMLTPHRDGLSLDVWTREKVVAWLKAETARLGYPPLAKRQRQRARRVPPFTRGARPSPSTMAALFGSRAAACKRLTDHRRRQHAICQFCGAQFLAHRASQRYCSRRCAGTATARVPVFAARGSHHPSAKLTEAQVMQIRGRHLAEESRACLALAFGVSKKTIDDIVTWKTWTHVLPD